MIQQPHQQLPQHSYSLTFVGLVPRYAIHSLEVKGSIQYPIAFSIVVCVNEKMDTTVLPNYSTPTQFYRQPRNMYLKSAHAVNVSHMWPVGANGKPKPKPKRPYTPYNLFYLLERELVVQKINGPPKSSGIKRKYAGMPLREEDQIKPSSRYKNIIMAPYWYDPNMKEKRKHRKTHGMVSELFSIS